MRNKKMLTGVFATLLSVSMIFSSVSVAKAQEAKQVTEVLENFMESQTEEVGTQTENVVTEEISTEMETKDVIAEETSIELEVEELVTDEAGEYQAVFSEVGQVVKVEGQAAGETKKFLIACDKSGDYTLRYSDTDGDMGRILARVGEQGGGKYGVYLTPFTGFTGSTQEDYEANIALNLETGKTYVVEIEPVTQAEMSYELLFMEEPAIKSIQVDHKSYIVEANGYNWWGLSGFPFVVTYSDGSEQHLHGPRRHKEDAPGLDSSYLPYDDYGNYFVFELKDETQEFAFDHMRAGVYPVTITVSGKQVFEDVVKIQDLEELAGKTIIRLEQAFINEKAAEAEAAKENETIIIDMKKADGQIATVIPAEILEAALGRNVNIVLNMGTYTWTLNGEDIWTDMITDINLEVILNTNAISAEKVKELAKEKAAYQMSLTSDGWFGFDTTLSINVGNEYKGQNASLYYYNDEGKFELQSKGVIAENGYVNFDFSHASDYVIVIEKSETDNNQTTENDSNKNETDNNQTTNNESNKNEADNNQTTGNESNKNQINNDQTTQNGSESPKTGDVNTIYVWSALFAGIGFIFSKTVMKRKIK